MKKKTERPGRARVLSAWVFEGKTYQPGEVIELEQELMTKLQEIGVVDADPDAVAYAENMEG